MSIARGGVLLLVLGALLITAGFVVGSPNDAGDDEPYVLRGYGAESYSRSTTGEPVGVPAAGDGNLWFGAGGACVLVGAGLVVAARRPRRMSTPPGGGLE